MTLFCCSNNVWALVWLVRWYILKSLALSANSANPLYDLAVLRGLHAILEEEPAGPKYGWRNRVFLAANCRKAMKYPIAQSKGYAVQSGLSEHDEAVAIPYPCF